LSEKRIPAKLLLSAGAKMGGVTKPYKHKVTRIVIFHFIVAGANNGVLASNFLEFVD